MEHGWNEGRLNSVTFASFCYIAPAKSAFSTLVFTYWKNSRKKFYAVFWRQKKYEIIFKIDPLGYILSSRLSKYWTFKIIEKFNDKARLPDLNSYIWKNSWSYFSDLLDLSCISIEKFEVIAFDFRNHPNNF